MESRISITQSMELTTILGNQTDLTEEEQSEILSLESAAGKLSHAEATIRKEIDMLEKQLLSKNPEFTRLMLLRSKVKTVKEMQRKTKIILDDKYDKVFEKRGLIAQATDIYAAMIPETVKGRRGRPRLEPKEDE